MKTHKPSVSISLLTRSINRIRSMKPAEPEAHAPFYAARQAIRRHATGGNILILATIAAMVVANIPVVNQYYFQFWEQKCALQIGTLNVLSHHGEPMTLLAVINDALMAIFFFSIGLEIKREVLVGELSSIRAALLPILGAVGGMIVPIVIYIALSSGTSYAGGAAIPMATDIAFSLGILAILGSRVPLGLKIFLTTLAVVDDIGGIVIIAIFYSTNIEYGLLGIAAIILGVLLLGSRLHIKSKIFYIGLGGAVWFLFLNSGIHPTIAGVLVAFCVPATPVFPPLRYIRTIRSATSRFSLDDEESLCSRSILRNDQLDLLKEIESASDKVISPLQDLEDSLHPIVNNFIVPLFAFANAGIFLLDIAPVSIIEGVSLAVICGLVVGKCIGILFFSWITVKLGLAPIPHGTDWKMMTGISMLGGIGFTVSIFIANLSFGGGDPVSMNLLNHAKLGIVVGSVLAGIIAVLILGKVLPKGLQKRE